MKNIKKFTVIMMVMLMVVFTACGNKPDNMVGDESYRIIKLVEMTGEVNYTRDSKMQAAYLNMNFQNGDAVATGTESSASITLDEDKKIVMGADTSITMVAEGDSENSRTIITLDKGEIMNSIGEKLSPEAMYEIDTSNASIGVRGTVFYVKADGDTTVVYCHQGEVAIATGDIEESVLQGEAVKIEDNSVVAINTEDIMNELSQDMIDELSAVDEGTDEGTDGTSEAAQGSTIPDGAVLEADGFYWIRNDDGSWIKYDSQGYVVEEKIYSTGDYGDTYSIRTYTTDEYGYNYFYQALEYSVTTDELIATHNQEFVFVEERPLDGEQDGVVRKIWYNYKISGIYTDGRGYVYPGEMTVRIYENGSNELSDGWN